MYVKALVISIVLLFAPFHSIEKEWREADKYAQNQRNSWYEVFRTFGLDEKECEAIIFPELLRYSWLEDRVQKAALMSLYVKGGKSQSNFSVGVFQMKPSFLEEVEAAWMKSRLCEEYELYFIEGDSRDIRHRRVERIKDNEWQCVYLALFVKLMLEREPLLNEMCSSERIKYLSTAYNYSFSATLEELKRQQSIKKFHIDLIALKNTTFYSYSELAAKRLSEID